jgi:hypothetical protein
MTIRNTLNSLLLATFILGCLAVITLIIPTDAQYRNTQQIAQNQNSNGETSNTNQNIIEDDDRDGIPNDIEQSCSSSTFCDTDGDGTEDYLDTDSDGDGLKDADEKGRECQSLANCQPADSNGDLIPDYRQREQTNSEVRGIYEMFGILFFVMICIIGYALYSQSFTSI